MDSPVACNKVHQIYHDHRESELLEEGLALGETMVVPKIQSEVQMFSGSATVVGTCYSFVVEGGAVRHPYPLVGYKGQEDLR